MAGLVRPRTCRGHDPDDRACCLSPSMRGQGVHGGDRAASPQPAVRNPALSARPAQTDVRLPTGPASRRARRRFPRARIGRTDTPGGCAIGQAADRKKQAACALVFVFPGDSLRLAWFRAQRRGVVADPLLAAFRHADHADIRVAGQGVCREAMARASIPTPAALAAACKC